MKNLKLYRSSAGSGKTYTLALNYLAISLLGNKSGYQNHRINITMVFGYGDLI